MDLLHCHRNAHDFFRHGMILTLQRGASSYSHCDVLSLWNESQHNHAIDVRWPLTEKTHRPRWDQSNTQFIGQRVRVSWSSPDTMPRVDELR